MVATVRSGLSPLRGSGGAPDRPECPMREHRARAARKRRSGRAPRQAPARRRAMPSVPSAPSSSRPAAGSGTGAIASAVTVTPNSRAYVEAEVEHAVRPEALGARGLDARRPAGEGALPREDDGVGSGHQRAESGEVGRPRDGRAVRYLGGGGRQPRAAEGGPVDARARDEARDDVDVHAPVGEIDELRGDGKVLRRRVQSEALAEGRSVGESAFEEVEVGRGARVERVDDRGGLRRGGCCGEEDGGEEGLEGGHGCARVWDG